MPDVNILVYAHRQDEAVHRPYRAWLEKLVAGPQPFALSVLVAVGFVRVVTNPKLFRPPTPLALALAAVDEIGSSPLCRWVAPDTNHFGQVASLCRAVRASGKLVADAQHAALAIAEGCTFVTRDGDFAKFARHGLDWTHLEL
jgi:toxin-antitoxin system PIN domain toxin